MQMKFIVGLVFGASAVLSAAASTSFGVDNFYSDHMILQRDKPVRIAGSATFGETVKVSIGPDCAASVMAGADDRWQVTLPPRHRGGPYTVRVESGSGNVIEFEDVWYGEVWVCSGQSNMEYPLIGDAMYYHHPFGRRLAHEAKDELLRVFFVPHGVSLGFKRTDFPGRPCWKPMLGEDAFKWVSSVGYFFARRLREELGPEVPVGIVSTSWGGTLIEPWIPYEAFANSAEKATAKEVESHVKMAKKLADQDLADCDAVNAELQKNLVYWVNERFLKTDPVVSAEAVANWGKVEVERSQWKIGARSSMRGMASPGIAWYRFEFTLPESWAKAKLKFHVDAVNDCDETYFDGVKIGETRVEDGGEYWAKVREYAFTGPAKGGKHVIAIRAMDHRDWGGVNGRVTLQNVESGEILRFDEGPWMERIEFKYDVAKRGGRPPVPVALTAAPTSCQTPTTLFNAMINPATSASIRGAIWYQGCSNFWMGEKYAELQKLLIQGWRDAWQDPELVFIITQLSAFQDHVPGGFATNDPNFWQAQEPKDCVGYGPVRKGQDLCRTFYKTGVACTIDIGEPFDIHPNNKEEVGARLAREALRIAYGRSEWLPGPRFAKAELNGAKVTVSFDFAGKGLEIVGGRLNPHLVALAGEDGVFYWGEGELTADGKLVAWCDQVKKPVRIQYCHSAYPPNVNFRRAEDGYPVFPFDEAL